MVREYSLGLEQTLTPCKSQACQSCGLYLNQSPLFDRTTFADVFWVGLSAVQVSLSEIDQPLSPLTRSGALIHQVEKPFLSELNFYRTNIVKCLPLKDGKIRYPTEKEMSNCFPNLEHEISQYKPRMVFLLGKQVASFVEEQFSSLSTFTRLTESSFKKDNCIYVSVSHPSYILVYKRKFVDQYVYDIQYYLEELLAPQPLVGNFFPPFAA